MRYVKTGWGGVVSPKASSGVQVEEKDVVLDKGGVERVPYSSIGRSKHAECESVSHFDGLKMAKTGFGQKTSCKNY